MVSIDTLPESSLPNRCTTSVLPPTDATPSFILGPANRSYKHQYSNIYFVRLRILRDFVEERAREKWDNLPEKPVLVSRVLEVLKGQICYIVGTVYMEMPLKPNVLEDIARDHSIPPPPPLPKFYSPDDSILLEDESGRLRLAGNLIKSARLVTGVIIGVLGCETENGDFEVVDICYAGMAPHSTSDAELAPSLEKMDIDDQPGPSSANISQDEWIGIVSGLDIGSLSPSDAQIQMLVEYLTGEVGGVDEQVSASQISRLIIAGNSLAPVALTGKGEGNPDAEDKKARRYGYDNASFSPHPTLSLSAHLLDIGRVMPIHILPGDTDPSGTILPQQSFPRAMFGPISTFPSFSCETNPTYIRLSTGNDSDAEETVASSSAPPSIERTLLVNSGQPLNDMFKYLPSPPHTRLSVLESTLKWRHIAPTAPDTLWCHPYFAADPFLMTETPNLYIVGGQKKFGTRLAVDQDDPNKKNRCRIVLVPGFANTGVLVLVNLRTLDVKTVDFAVEGMTGSGNDGIGEESNPPKPTSMSVEPQLESSAPQSSGSQMR